MMKKTVALIVIGILIPLMVSAEFPTALKKYVTPANITQLDWLLLKAQVESFSTPTRWDEYGLVKSITLLAGNESGLVAMFFDVDKQRYFSLSDDTIKKVFADVVLSASAILSHTIPEVKGGANVQASFSIPGGGIIAEYKQGQVSLRK